MRKITKEAQRLFRETGDKLEYVNKRLQKVYDRRWEVTGAKTQLLVLEGKYEVDGVEDEINRVQIDFHCLTKQWRERREQYDRLERLEEEEERMSQRASEKYGAESK